ncbi:MAG: hypothetical protein WC623_23585 [Pedobacter sp.]|uniref:hypothetical protein n=1 Tax=Pedobacter sp. TaxID=1411316 RepID=UPI0035670BF7
MAIFGNFEEEAPVEVIKKILQGVEEQGNGALSKNRYREQLRGLIQLRKLGKEFKIAMGTITKFKVEKDPFYQDGIKKGTEKTEARKNHDFVENLILELNLSDEKIARIVEVSDEYVKKFAKKLLPENKSIILFYQIRWINSSS